MELKISLEELNKIIREAIYHGGDLGGPYFCNKENLYESLEPLCERYNLEIAEDEYGFVELRLK